MARKHNISENNVLIILLLLIILAITKHDNIDLSREAGPDCIDNDQDGFGNPSSFDCDRLGLDCDDENDAINPAALEICGNGIDDNCDGYNDESCECTTGDTRECGSSIGVCEFGEQLCTGGTWSGCAGGIKPSSEVCGDDLDNNCDGAIDDGCDCLPGDSKSCGNDNGECKTGTQSCENGRWSTCSGNVDPSLELCDNLDNDCDGNIDDDLVRACIANNTAGKETCRNGTWNRCMIDIDPIYSYSCINDKCEIDANGNYASFLECNSNCYSSDQNGGGGGSENNQSANRTTKKKNNHTYYSCKNNQCTLDSNGPFVTPDCGGKCKKYEGEEDSSISFINIALIVIAIMFVIYLLNMRNILSKR